MRAQIVVIAKAPVPGRVKTRLTPPFTPLQAAQLAEAALQDTLATALDVPVARHVLALDGAAGPWLPPGFDVMPQRGRGLDERLAAAFADAHARLPVPVILIGMDTPQVGEDLLSAASRLLVSDSADAVLGPADDGGFWMLGLRRPDRRLLVDVPMSVPQTCAVQLSRLVTAGLRVRLLPVRTDVDDAADALTVAAHAPHSRFAAVLRALLPQELELEAATPRPSRSD